VRADLPRGIQAAQIAHAAGESSPGALPAGTYAVVLTTKGERELVQLADDLRRAGAAFTAIFEPDAPYDGALMAIGLVPGRKEALRRHVARLPLLR
jgi:hypothetical protein